MHLCKHPSQPFELIVLELDIVPAVCVRVAALDLSSHLPHDLSPHHGFQILIAIHIVLRVAVVEVELTHHLAILASNALQPISHNLGVRLVAVARLELVGLVEDGQRIGADGAADAGQSRLRRRLLDAGFPGFAVGEVGRCPAAVGAVAGAVHVQRRVGDD